jgi:signal transduction histidine kinase
MEPYKNMSILLVDDEEDIREVLGLSLQDIGYTVYLAKSGEEAFQIFNEKQPPVVLTDIKMEGMDGIDLLRKIKQDSPETEVIMITGHGDTDLAIKSLKYEATDFITKPINDDALEVALRRARERISTREQLKTYTANLEALLKEKMELQDHLSSLGLMIGSISHGMKGLLTRLDAGLYDVNIGIEKKEFDRIHEGYGIVKNMISRIKKMVLDILYYAKKRDLEKKKTDVASFSKDVVNVVKPIIQDQQIIYIEKFDESLGNVEIDPDSIHSALMNIFENSIDACVEDKTKQKHHIIFSVKRSKKHIEFCVEDNGVGMDTETCGNVFTLFFSAKNKKGTGLGLFVANKIVEEHEGSIEVTSELGKGSLFKIKIPHTNV